MKDWIQDLVELLGRRAVITVERELKDSAFDLWPVAVKWKNLGEYPYKPDAIVRPVSIEQVSRLMAWAAERRIPVTPRGAGSGVVGAAIALQGGISLDLSSLDQIISIDETNLMVKAQAGALGSTLESALNQRGYTLNHSPQSLERSTIGGWVSTRASGQFSSRWGSIEDLVLAFTVVLPGGEIVSIKPAPRAAEGPDLRHLFIGSEGIMGVIVDVTRKIFPLPEYRRLEAFRFSGLEAGLAAMRRIAQSGLRPFLARLYDPAESKHVLNEPAFDSCLLFLGFEGPQLVAQAEYASSLKICHTEGGQAMGPDPVAHWMSHRFDFSFVEDRLKTVGGYAETIEIAHFWDSILDAYSSLADRLTPLADRVFGHFSHIYPQGTSLYLILTGQARDDQGAQARLQEIWDVSMRLCLEKGAAISHHHGIGLARLPYIRDSLGSEFILLERVKRALDPNGIMNPGKFGLP